MNVGAILRTTAARLPDKKAVIFGGTSITFRELDQASDRVAGFLLERSVKQGERVGIVFPNIPEFAPVYFGILRAGAVGVPLDIRLKGEELAAIFDDAAIGTLFITDDKFKHVRSDLRKCAYLRTTAILGSRIADHFHLDSILETEAPKKTPLVEIDEDDEALFLYTSGTTGKPKGVVLTFRNLDYSPLTTERMAGAGENDVIGLILPITHISGPVTCNQIALHGSTLCLFENLRPDKMLQALDTCQVNYFYGVPPIFESLLRVPRRETYGLQRLRFVAMMGTSVPLPLIQEFRQAFPRTKVLQGYGLTETSPFITFLPPEHADAHMGSIGLPVPGIQIKLIDTNGQEVSRGEVGEIAVKGPMVMKGYHNDPEATEAMIRDGWLYTGDLGSIDEEGFVYHLGRKDDLIITGGLNVFPAEVERVLAQHPDILEAAVVGVPEPHRGHLIKAAVVLRPGKTPDKREIMAFCRKHLADFKTPKLIEFREALPNTPTGKVSRRDLL